MWKRPRRPCEPVDRGRSDTSGGRGVGLRGSGGRHVGKRASRGGVECGRRLAVYLRRRRREAEVARKRNYMALYIPHVALGLKQILELSDRQESAVVATLNKMLERTHLEQ